MNFKSWLLLTEAKKAGEIASELTGNNPQILEKLKSIIPADAKQDLQVKLLPIAAYFYKQQNDLNTLKQDLHDYANLVKLNKMPIITIKDDLTIDNKHFQNYISWTEVIHGKQHEDQVKTQNIKGDVSDQKLIAQSTDGKIKVYEANSPDACIILGRGQKFCISQPANTMWKSYRDSKTSSFYFVYDSTRNDDLSIVVVDATIRGIELTDRRNQTGQFMQDPYSTQENRIKSDPALYFKYLKEHGIDTSIFKNIAKTQQEEDEDKKIGRSNSDYNWFLNLSTEEKSKYIGRGHKLTNDQFDFLFDNKINHLLSQYVKTGLQLDQYQIEKIATNKDLKDNYLHNRLIAIQQRVNLSDQEFDLLNPKQKEEFIKLAISKGITLTNNQFDYLFDNKINDLLSQYVKTGLRLDQYQIEKIATNNDLKDNYLHNRLIAAQQQGNLSGQEFDLFNPKQKKEFLLGKKIDTLTGKQFDYVVKNIKSEYYNSLNLKDKIYFARKTSNQDLILKLAENPNLDNIDILYLLQYATDKDKIAEIIIQKKPKLSDEDINSLIKNVNNKDKIAELIINKNPELYDDDVANLLDKATDKEKIAKLLGKDNISKLSYDLVGWLLKKANDQKQMAQILNQYYTDKDKIAKIINQYGIKISEPSEKPKSKGGFLNWLMGRSKENTRNSKTY